MKKPQLLLIFVFLFSFSNFFAQTELDSLKNELAKTNELKKTVKQLINISFKYIYIDIDSSFSYANKAYKLSKQNNYKLGIAESRLRQSTYWVRNEDFKKAEDLLTEALKLYIQLKDTIAIAGTYASFGNMYLSSTDDDLDKAAKYFIKASSLYEIVGSKKHMADIQLSIGGIFHLKQNYNVAIDYYTKAYDLYSKLNNKQYMSMTTANIGVAFHELGNYEKALENYQLSINEDLALGYKTSLGLNLNNAGSVLTNLSRFDDAEHYLMNALKIHKEQKNEGRKAYTYEYLGILYSKMNKFNLAKIYLDSCLVIAKKMERANQKARVYEALSENYIKQNDYKNAFINLYLNKTTNDSIAIINNKQEVKDLLLKYESEKNKRKIQGLDYQNKMNEVALAKANTEKTWLIIIIVVILLFVITLSVVIWQRIKNKKIIALKDKQLLQNDIEKLKKDKELASFTSLIKGQEEERKRIASELHDSVGSMLSTIKLNYGLLKNKNDKDYLRTENMLDDACNEVRRVAHNMMPEALLKFGLIEAINDLVSKINHTNQLHIDLIVLGEQKEINATTELYLYRIVQELINNILKHAEASEVIIQLNINGNMLNLMVEDNGVGFKDSEKSGIGLKNINSRINVLNGNISFDSEAEKGCIVMIDIPNIAA